MISGETGGPNLLDGAVAPRQGRVETLLLMALLAHFNRGLDKMAKSFGHRTPLIVRRSDIENTRN